MKIHPQIITKNKHPEFVIIPYLEYEAILAELEDKADIKLIDEFHANPQETFSLEIAQKISNGENPIKVFRELRGISQANLAKKAGISRQYLNQIENKTRIGSAKTLKKMASLLNIDLNLLIND
jgi:DNA-binding XRE family transcriptional regulator